jgi:hypothetical protein
MHALTVVCLARFSVGEDVDVVEDRCPGINVPQLRVQIM